MKFCIISDCHVLHIEDKSWLFVSEFRVAQSSGQFVHFNLIKYGNKKGLWLVLSDRFWPLRPSWWLVELSNVNPAVGTWQLLERFVGVAEGQLWCYDEYYSNITMELKSFHSYYYHLIQVVLFLCLWARQAPRYILADAGFLCDKASCYVTL